MEIFAVGCVLFALAESVYLADDMVSSLTSATKASLNAIQASTETTTPISTVTTRLDYNVSDLKCVENVDLMFRDIEVVPPGCLEVLVLNLAYNRIASLPAFVFSSNNYTNVEKIMLHQNRIENVSASAFKDLRHVGEIDLSDNFITALDPYTFNRNGELKKIVMVNNRIALSRRRTFILAHSLEHLVLSNNRVDQIYEINFLGVPNLRTLFLNGNPISKIGSSSFRSLSRLRYLSLANTGVHSLSASVFSSTPPRMLNMDGTPMAMRFEPRLTTVTGESVVRLLELTEAMGGDDVGDEHPESP